MTDSARNVLEIAISRGREGALGMQTILWVFASSTIYVPSATEPSEKTTNFLPVLFERGAHKWLPVILTWIGAMQ